MGNSLQTVFCQGVDVNDVDESGKESKPESRKLSDSIKINITDMETRRFLCTLTLLRGNTFGDLIRELGTEMKYTKKRVALRNEEEGNAEDELGGSWFAHFTHLRTGFPAKVRMTSAFTILHPHFPLPCLKTRD